MPVARGSRLGCYDIVSALGAGGMGEVYRARDTRLDRDVAIKVLPDAFAHDPERLARFEREAKTLAALNHPNIAQIYGLEEYADMGSGFSRTGRALVMELVEGPTLAELLAGRSADRLAHSEGRGRPSGRPLPIDEALTIARQIADALEAAHEQGIIHRDLKPANVKVRPDGVVKVLDFGLAKALDQVSAGATGATASPTITSPAMMTGVGVILGTAAYMSPGQVQGRPASLADGIMRAPSDGAAGPATATANYGVLDRGTLVYATGDPARFRRTLVWADRTGQEQVIPAPPRAYYNPRLSPDGTRIALDIRDQDDDIWIWDVVRETLTRLTFDASQETYPV